MVHRDSETKAWSQVCAAQGRRRPSSPRCLPSHPPTQLQDGERTEAQAQGRGPRFSICHPPEDKTLPTQATSRSCLTWAATSSLASPMPVTSALCLPPQLTGHRVSSGAWVPTSHQRKPQPFQGKISEGEQDAGWERVAGLWDPLLSLQPHCHWFLNCVPRNPRVPWGQAMKRGPEVPSWSFKGGESQLAPDKSVGLLLLAFAPTSPELGRPALSLRSCLHPGMGSSAFKLLSPWMSVCGTKSCSLMLTEGKGKLRLRERGAGPSDGTTRIPPDHWFLCSAHPRSQRKCSPPAPRPPQHDWEKGACTPPAFSSPAPKHLGAGSSR